MSADADHIRKGSPSMIKTSFGWVVMGALDSNGTDVASVLTLQSETAAALNQFWELENLPPAPISNPADAYCEEHFVATHTRDAHGRYSVSLPFQNNVPPMDSNVEVAQRSFHYLEGRFARNPQLSSAYRSRMQEFIQEDHLRLALRDVKYLLPHHCVVKMDSSTSAYRIVFNASSCDTSGFSLNDRIHVGPRLQKNICQILMNFSSHPVALTCDIKSMYCQVLLNEESRQFHQLLWRESQDQPLRQYQMQRLTFGVSTSAFLAQRVIHQLAIDEGPKFPHAAPVLDNDCYVDNIVSGAESVEDAFLLQNQLIALCHAGGFPLRKWASSHAAVIQHLDQELLEVPLTFQTDSPSIKLLGLYWEPSSDCFRYHVTPFEGPLTERNVLRFIASTFDPMAWIGLVTTWMKCCMQKMWVDKLDWDEDLTADIAEDWQAFMYSFSSLSQLRIPRFIPLAPNSTLLGFSDASQRAYGAVIYRFNPDTGDSRLLLSKSKVAPLKTQSIPRLELCAALLLANLCQSVLSMSSPSRFANVFLFTDSSTVLSWLRKSPHSLPTFEGNRVAKIQELNVDSWGHVSSANNPADCLSRGLTAVELIDHPLWWYMPADLLEFPHTSNDHKYDTEDEPSALLMAVSIPPANHGKLLERFSSYNRLIRVLAYVHRFIRNCRLKPTSDRSCGPLSAFELRNSLVTTVKISQLEDFSDDFERLKSGQLPSKPLLPLSPSIDESGCLTVGGHLENSDLPPRAKHPWLLSKSCWLSRLICDHYHQTLLHAGSQTSQSMIRRKFWILSLRSLLRNRIHQCPRCRRLTGKPFEPFMANLPECRVKPFRVFSTVSTDFAGPISAKESSRRTKCILKAYICIFVCTSTKAVHLEYVSSLSADAFLAALTRFVSRRGLPACIISDCGTNFVGADRQMKESARFLKENSDQLISSAASLSIEWSFNPAYAPHFGGLHEAGVRSCKNLLLRQVGATVLTIEELSTLLCRIEAVLNSRPLVIPGNGPLDGVDYLTPGHFLIGTALMSTPEAPSNLSVHPRTRWLLLQKIGQSFWARWSLDYLNSLIQRKKWVQHNVNPQVGQLVFVRHLQTSPLTWPLGIITALHPGDDGTVRVVGVRIGDKVFKRPAINLVPLPASE